MGTPVREGAGLAKFCISEALVQKITIVDFSSAWVMKDVFQIARAKPGWMSREDVLKFYREQKAEGVELMHDYWHDCSPKLLKSLTDDVGLPVTCYVFFTDFAVSKTDLKAKIDSLGKIKHLSVLVYDRASLPNVKTNITLGTLDIRMAKDASVEEITNDILDAINAKSQKPN